MSLFGAAVGLIAVAGLATATAVDREAGRAVILGVLGPQVAATVSWVMMTRAHARDATRLYPLMLKAFAAKFVFFGIYVVIMLSVLHVPPVPFVASFTVAFVGLLAAEAVSLKRMLDGLSSVHS